MVITLEPVGVVVGGRTEPIDDDWGGIDARIRMDAARFGADAVSARNLFFREKALWQYERGYRMDDLRRLVRQYKLTQDNVFPTGNFTRNGTPSGQFGTLVAFPIPDSGIGSEISNPNYKGCLDTKA